MTKEQIMDERDLREWYMRYIDALNSHDMSGMDTFIGDELMAGGDLVKRDDIVAVLEGIVDAVPDIRWQVEEMLVDRDGVAVRLINTGTPVTEWLGVAPSGKSFEIVEYAIYKVRDGRFVQMTNLHDSAEMVRQLSA